MRRHKNVKLVLLLLLAALGGCRQEPGSGIEAEPAYPLEAVEMVAPAGSGSGWALPERL